MEQKRPAQECEDRRASYRRAMTATIAAIQRAIDEINTCESERQAWLLEFAEMKQLIRKRLAEIH